MKLFVDRSNGSVEAGMNAEPLTAVAKLQHQGDQDRECRCNEDNTQGQLVSFFLLSRSCHWPIVGTVFCPLLLQSVSGLNRLGR